MIFIDLSKIPLGESHQEFEWIIDNNQIDENNKELFIIGIFDINNKHRRDYFFDGSIKYTMVLKCDRCNALFNCEFDEHITFVIKVNSDIEDLDIINTNSNIVDLLSYLRDIVITSAPLKRLCNEDCKGLCIKCGTNLNKNKCNCNKQEA